MQRTGRRAMPRAAAATRSVLHSKLGGRGDHPPPSAIDQCFVMRHAHLLVLPTLCGLAGSTGFFSMQYPVRNWDSCCWGGTNPDIVLEVWVGGALWLTTSEVSDVTTDLSFSLTLPTRAIRGSVQWAGGQRIPGAVVMAYDNDPVGRESMGQAIAGSDGTFLITYNPNKLWDTCCGSSTNPDIVLEVWIENVLWLTTAEISNVAGDRSFTLTVPRYTIAGMVLWAGLNQPVAGATVTAFDNDPVWLGGTRWLVSTERSNVNGDTFFNLQLTKLTVAGSVYWQETCSPASLVSVFVRDDDTAGSETMGSATTGPPGTYAISMPILAGGDSNWDGCCGGDVYPDVFSEFVYSGASKGRTPVTPDLVLTPGRSTQLQQGATWMWRGDGAVGAIATQAALKLDTVDWVEIEEFLGCRKVRVSIIVNFQRNGDMSDATYAKLVELTKKGIAENWSRTGMRAVTLSNGRVYEVYTQVVERKDGHNIEVEQVLDKEFERSNNVGSVAFFDFDPVVYYNEGYFRSTVPADWEAAANYSFVETAGHEFGHSILRAAPPAGDPLPNAPMYPATGDWDIMLYYNGSPPPGAYDRSFAAEDDVRRLVGIAGVKRWRGGSCPCPS
ncbi:hypothetical protein ABPG75_001496 [Micractinium tetrahymenae]